MGRHSKHTVDYFPHYVHHGKTLFILEQRWGNDGYAGFYKLLELLSDEDGHVYNARETDKWEFLIAKLGISGAEMCQKLADLRVIDPELWKIRVIWMDSLVESVKDVYRKRNLSVPVKPSISVFLPPEIAFLPEEINDTGGEGVISGAGNRQSKVKKSKGKESKVETTLASSCNELPSKPPSVFLVIPLIGDQEFSVTDDAVAEWQGLYPGIDVKQELRNIRGWNLSHPGNRKTKRGIAAHITSWLSREQNRCRTNGTAQDAPLPESTRSAQATPQRTSWGWDKKGFFKVVLGQRIRLELVDVPEWVVEKQARTDTLPQRVATTPAEATEQSHVRTDGRSPPLPRQAMNTAQPAAVSVANIVANLSAKFTAPIDASDRRRTAYN